MAGIQAGQHGAPSTVSPTCLPRHIGSAQQAATKAPCDLTSPPPIMLSLVSSFLPQGLCTISPCLGDTVLLSTLLPLTWCPHSCRSGLHISTLTEHFPSRGPHASLSLFLRCYTCCPSADKDPMSCPYLCVCVCSLTQSTGQRSTTALNGGRTIQVLELEGDTGV